MLQLAKTFLSKRKTAVLFWKRYKVAFHYQQRFWERRKRGFILKCTTGHAKAETSALANFESKHPGQHLPFSDGGIKTLPVGGWDEVVVTEIVLVVLLDSGAAGAGWFLTGEYISSHLLLLLSLQGNYFITNWGQLAAAAAATAATDAATAAAPAAVCFL